MWSDPPPAVLDGLATGGSVSTVTAAPSRSTQEQHQQILALCRHIGLERNERYELALAILGVEIRSFDELWESGAERLLAAMVGWQAIRRLRVPESELRTSEHCERRQRIPGLPRSSAQLRKVMAMCREMGLDDDQRHEFASAVLGVRVETFAGMDAVSACLLIDALNGYHAVEFLTAHPKPAVITEAARRPRSSASVTPLCDNG